MVMRKNRRIQGYFLVFAILTIGILLYIMKNPHQNSGLAVHLSVENMLNANSLQNCNILVLGEYMGLEYRYAEEIVTDQQIEEYIDRIISSLAEFEINQQDKIIDKGDIISTNVKVYLEDEIKYSAEKVTFTVGVGDYSLTVEECLIGESVGSQKKIEMMIDESMGIKLEKDISYTLIFEICGIGEFVDQKLDDKVAKKIFDCESVEECYQKIRTQLTNKTRAKALQQAREAMIQLVIDKSKFLFDKREIAQYSMDIIHSFESEAYLYNLDLEMYVKEKMEMTMEQFYEYCYLEGEKYVKEYLVIGAIAEQENISISQQEVLDVLGDEYDSDVLENSKDVFYVEYQILLNKVCNFLFQCGSNMVTLN